MTGTGIGPSWIRPECTYDDPIIVERDARAEEIARRSGGIDQLGLLRPESSSTNKYIHGSRINGYVVVSPSPTDESISAQRNAVSKLIPNGKADCVDFCFLSPERASFQEDVCSALASIAVVRADGDSTPVD